MAKLQVQKINSFNKTTDWQLKKSDFLNVILNGVSPNDHVPDEFLSQIMNTLQHSAW